ncbi:flavocytochrome c [Anaerobranca gottschalkii]|uniref:Fumarate reductase flavoprotein subunit n=1 Tax=Anaerobranca gottschalkii DSM 13577 TaxID=1120990 RepID=A0A1I0BCU1_9FIRM|nr:flavocytochrome c [Anaerobranca gottschalkii]SET04768.1 fumarate reductase flavoprotein subunit [Anaerobranca gottschalkii DSM 13577]
MNKKLITLLIVVMVTTIFAGCSSNSQDVTTDVVIIGSGGAGLAAAIEARDAGKEVIVVEMMNVVGGNTLRATGGLNAAGTSVQKALGIEDSAELHFEDTMKGGYYKNNEELVRILTSQAADGVEWLISLGADLSNVGRMGGSSQDRTHRPTGGAPVGPHIIQVLRENAQAKGIEIRLETKATEILVKDNKVVGIKVEEKDGKVYNIKADAVIIATGGFGANLELFAQLNPNLDGFGTTNHAGANGSGILMAQAIGAAVIDMEEIQTHPTVVPSNGYMITEAVRGNGAILINRNGERFVNELETRDVVSSAILAQEGKTAFLVFDNTVKESLSAIENYIRMGLTVEGNTIEELAANLGIDPAALSSTVEKYNEFVLTGVDEDFSRGDMPRALKEGSFYAIEVGPAVHHTMGGLLINSQAQVLDTEGKVIPGLYAAGEVTGGIHGANRLGGNALTDLIVFGRIAGKSAGNQ